MISVAMTTYNGEKYVLEQLKSILHQTRPVGEIIICDDTSSDKTVLEVEQFIKENPTKTQIKFIKNEENLGYTQNFHKAIEYTQGDYTFLSDQDDLWEPQKVERMLSTMEQYHIELLCSNYRLIDAEGAPLQKCVTVPAFIRKAKLGLNKIHFFPLLFRNVSQGCTYCFTKKIKDIYLKTNSLDIIHDYQLILIASAFHSCYFLNEKLIQYRIHENNSVGLPSKKSLKKIRLHFKYYVPDLAKFLRKLHKYEKIPWYHLNMLLIFLKIPVVYLWIQSRINYMRK